MAWLRFDAARMSGLAVAAVVMLSPAAARGQYTWTGNANRTWDTSSLNWTLGSGNIAWVDNNAAVLTSSGTGTITVAGSLAVTDLTVAGAYTLTGGTISMSGSASTLTIQSDTTAIGSVLAGTVGLRKAGVGTLVLTSANTYTGTTTINAGTLQVGNGGATGSLGTGAIVNNGNLVYNRSTGSIAFPNAGITGSGSMSLTSGGRVDLQNGFVVDLTGRQGWSASATTGRSNGFTLADSGTVTLRSQTGIFMSGMVGTANSDTGVLNVDTSAGNANVDLNVAVGVNGVNYSLARLNVTSGTGSITLSNTTGLSWGTGGAWIRQLSLNGRDVNVSANIPYFGTITVTNSGSSSTFSGNIGTTGSTGTVFTKAGAGTLSLTGTNTFSGATAVTGGVLQFVKPASLYSGSTASWTAANISTGSGATLAMSVGASNFTTGNVTTLLTNLGGLGGAVTNNGLQAGSAIGFDTSLAGGSFTVADSIKDSTGTGGGAIGLVKLGGGTLTLSGSNAYTGATRINAGTLLLANPVSLYNAGTASWTAANITTGSGATLAVSVGASNFTAGNVTTLLTNLGGLGGSVTNNGLQAGSAIGFDTSLAGGSFTVADSIKDSTGTGGGAIGLAKLGSGTVTLSGSNSYTGGTQMNGGVLALGNVAALGSNGTISFGGGALQFSGANITDYSSRIASSGNAISIDTNGQNVTFASALASTNSGGLTKSGSGSLTLTASNSYAGTTTINAGTLQVGSGGATGSLGAGAIVNNGNLVYNRSTGSIAFPNAGITGSGSMSLTSGGRVDLQNGLVIDLTGRQGWTASATSGLYSGFTLAQSATVTLRSQTGISMYGAVGTVTSDSGVLNIDTSAGNGNVDLNIAVGVAFMNYSLARLNVTSGTGVITLSNTTGLSWGSTSDAWIRQISLNGSDVNVSANIPYFGTIAVTNSGTSSTFSGNIGTTGSTGTVFTKAGTGVLTLTGTNTYAGATAILGGILRVASSGRLSNTSGITMNGAGAELNYNSSVALTAPINFTQGTLSGTGTIGTAVTAGANDILSPGNSPGAQSFTSGLTWDPAGTYLWEMNDATGGNGTGWDIINVSGGSGLTINATSGTTFKIAITSLSGTAAGNATNFSATTSGSWTILSSASGISGFAANKFTLDRAAFTNTSSGSFTLSQVASGPNQTLVLAYNTISALSSSTSSVTGFRVMQNQATTTSVNLVNAGPDATGYALSQSAAMSLVSGSTGTLAASGTQAITFGYASTAATGARSGTLSFTNTGNSGDAGGSVSVSGAVVTNRVVTASAVDFGLVHLGASGTATSNFTSTGSDNDFTRITVANGSGGGLTVSGSSGFVFNGSGGSSRSVAGTFATAGALSGTISLTNSSAEAGGTLPGQVPGTTGLAYSASVFSGTATWNGAGGGSWGTGASSSWTSTGGVQAAPGTFPGYANTDVAIFSGAQGGTSTVLLNGATPSLAALSFTNTTGRYVIDQGSGGSLSLAAVGGKPTVDVVAGGLHEIKTAILGTAGLQKLGGGTLVLSGSSNYSGGTDISVGTLAVNGSLGGAVNVASGAILGGAGALNGLVTVANGGILAPGNSPGTLTMNAGLVLADTSSLNFELSATDFTIGGGKNDLIVVNGNFTLDGVLNVTGLGDFSTVANNTTWRLFTYDIGGTFTNNGLSLGSIPSVGASGKYFQIDTATAGQVNLVIVPEPSALAIAGIGIVSGCVAVIQRHRRRTRGS